jgi:hypothetical protein
MGEGYDAIQRGGRAACNGGGGSLMTHSAGFVTTQRKAFKYVNMLWLLNHTGTPDILNRSWQVCHTLTFTFLKTLIALKLKCR